MTPRVVFDTNVIVSAVLDTQQHLLPEGRPSLCLRMTLAGAAELVASDILLAEYEEVLLRPRFALPAHDVRAFVAFLRRRAILVEPRKVPPRVKVHPEDAHVLGTAIAGRAAFLVTGNRRHFPVRHRNIQILSPGEFLAAILRGVMSA